MLRQNEEKLILKDVHTRLRKAARGADLTALNALFNTFERQININDPDPISGRTAMHEAARHPTDNILLFLAEKGGNLRLQDKEGFTPFELFFNEREFNPANLNHELGNQQFIVNEANKKAPTATKIILLENIIDLNKVLDENKDINRLGLLIRVPNCIKSPIQRDIHVMPVLLERKSNIEIFIQLDSALGSHYILPKSDNKNVVRLTFYNPFLRQQSNHGCFADGIEILLTLLKSDDIIDFCITNSKPANKDLTKSLNDEEMQLSKQLAAKQITSLSDLQAEEQEIFRDLMDRQDYYNQNAILEFNGLMPVNKIFKLTNLPAILLPFVERYDTMRILRTRHPEQFTNMITTSSTKDCLSYILEHGAKRANEEKKDSLTDTDIRNNLSNPDKRYDFKGKSFSKRKIIFDNYYSTRLRFLNTFFFNILGSQTLTEKLTDFAIQKTSKF